MPFYLQVKAVGRDWLVFVLGFFIFGLVGKFLIAHEVDIDFHVLDGLHEPHFFDDFVLTGFDGPVFAKVQVLEGWAAFF